MTTLQKAPTNYSIDLFKFIMAFFVVAIHTHPLFRCTNESILTIYDLTVNMAVPFFFLASGYLLASKYSSFDQMYTNTSIVKDHIQKILRMYLIWMAIYMPIAIYKDYINHVPVLKAVALYIRGFVFIGEQYNSYPLWYLLSSIYAFLFILIALRFRAKPRHLLLISALVSIVSIGLDEFVSYKAALPTPLALARTLIIYAIENGRILRGLIFIPIGIRMAYQKLPLKAYLILFLSCFVANYFVTNSIVSRYLLYTASVSLFGIILHIDLKPHPIYRDLRSLSTKIYLLHMYIWTIYYFPMYREKRFGMDSFVVTALLSLFIGYLHLVYEKRKRKALAN